MKLICKIVLEEYGFSELAENSGPDVIMAKDNFKLTLKPDGSCFYLNTGIEYPVKDLAGLKKLFKEIKSQELQKFNQVSY